MSQGNALGLSQPMAWRRELARVAYAGMEISWFTPFFLFFVPAARQHTPYLTAGILALVMLSIYGWTALAEARHWSAQLERTVLLLIVPGLILAGWRAYLHPGLSLGDLSWVQTAGASVLAPGATAYWAIVAAVFFLWWRGLALGRRDYTFQTVSYAFRSGLLLLVVGTLLISYAEQKQVLNFIAPFFFCGLMAVALARLEEVGQIKGEAGRIFDLTWLGILVVVAATTVGLAGTLLAWAARPESIETMRNLWAPVGRLLREALLWLLAILLAPFEPLLRWLSTLVLQAWVTALESPLLGGLGAWQPIIVDDSGAPQLEQLFEVVFNALRLMCGAGVLVLLLLAGLYLLSQERKRLKEQEEVHQNLDAGLGDALAGLVRQVRDRLRRAAQMLGQFGVGGDLLAAISVRNIYANTTRLARQRGYPRHRAHTPYEYLADLRAAFPAAQAEAQAITDAYVAVHYGELPTGREEMEALRAAYSRLKESPLAAH